MTESKLKPANENPWYVLATIYGEQEGDIRKKNRSAWNAWACQFLTPEQKMVAAQRMQIETNELEVWRQQESEIRFAFESRMGDGYPFPNPKDKIDFSHTIFSNAVIFTGLVFPAEVSFEASIFEQRAIFENAAFLSRVHFDSAAFQKYVVFRSATFCADAYLIEVIFEGMATFDKAEFKHGAYFQNTKFGDNAEFRLVEFEHVADFEGAIFGGYTYFREAVFSVAANFSDCQFNKPTFFQKAEFKLNFPVLTGAVLHPISIFTARNISAKKDRKGDTKLIRLWPEASKFLEDGREACSRIHHVVSQQGRPEDEHFFFRMEMGFNVRIGPVWKRAPYWLFDATSEFGYSLFRPSFLLLVLIVSGAGAYAGYFASPDFIATGMSVENRWLLGLGFSTSNVLPTFGFGRVFFEPGFHSALDWPIKLAAGVQSVLGVALLFFLALGLRTRFRLR